MGHKIGRTLVGELLHKLDYSLQSSRKTLEGSDNPDRDAQFNHINQRVRRALAKGEPAISVDTKKKELVGDFKNAGREWRPEGKPEQVRVHDFVIPELGRAAPYRVGACRWAGRRPDPRDIAGNAGWVSVGVDHDRSVTRDALRQSRRLDRRAASGVQHGRVKGSVLVAAGKQKDPWPGQPPAGARAVDVGDPAPRRIGGGQRSVALQARSSLDSPASFPGQ